MTVSGAIWTSFQNASSTMGIGQTVAGAFATLSGSLFSIVAYGLLALQILITNIESYIIIGGGALLLGFNGSKWTQVFAEKYLGYAVSVGIKLFVLYLIVGLGQNLANTWVTQLGTFTPETVIQVGVAALIYGAMGIMVPGIAGSMLNGSPSMSLGNVAGAAAGVAAGMAGAAMAGAGLATGGASNLAKLAGMVSSGGKDTPLGTGFGGTDALTKLATQASTVSGSGGTAPLGGTTTSSASPVPGGMNTSGSAPPEIPSSSFTSATLPAGSSSTPDSIGGGTTGASASNDSAVGTPTSGTGSGNNQSLFQSGVDSLGQSRDQVARSEGGSGGVQIRLGHSE